MKRALLTIALLAIIASGAVGIASAQGELTLESLAKRLDAMLGRVDTNEQRLAAIETAIAPTPTPTDTDTPENKASLTIGQRMNVWSGPGTQYEIIGAANAGDTFDITGQNLNRDWWQIEYEGAVAWVYAPYVTAFHVGSVEIVAAPTATPVPAQTQTEFGEDLAIAAAALMALDWQNDQAGWLGFSETERKTVAVVYAAYLKDAAEACKLSYKDMTFLINKYGAALENSSVYLPGGGMPRGWLLGFLRGWFQYWRMPPSLLSCEDMLTHGAHVALDE